MFYMGLTCNPTPPPVALRSERHAEVFSRLILPLRPLHDEARRGLVEWEFDHSSFAPKLGSAVEKVAVCHGRLALSQRSGE